LAQKRTPKNFQQQFQKLEYHDQTCERKLKRSWLFKSK